MSKKKVYTAALIGCGRIGFSLGFDKKREQPASHTMALMANKRIRLETGCDTDKKNLEKWEEYTKKLCTYSDSDTLYARHKCNIVTIAVNENAHKKESLDAIRSKPDLVILEKPVALNLKEALEIKKTADENNVAVLINHERRFADDYVMAKKYISRIGKMLSIRAKLDSGMAVYNAAEEKSGAYSLIHDGTHLVDAVLYFLEDEKPSELMEMQREQEEIRANSLLSKLYSLKGEDTIQVNSILNSPIITGVWKDEKNCIRQMTANYSCEKCPDVSISISGRSRFFGFEIVIEGTEGRICIGNGYLNFYQRKPSKLYSNFFSLLPDKSIKCPKKTNYFSNMIQNAVDYLDGKAELKSTINTGINALAILEEIKYKLMNY